MIPGQTLVVLALLMTTAIVLIEWLSRDKHSE